MTKKHDEIPTQVIVNKLSFWGFLENRWRTWKASRHKKPMTDEQREESAKVKAQGKQIKALQKINDALLNEIDELTGYIGSGKNQSMEEKLLDAGLKFLSRPKQPQTLINQYTDPQGEPQKNLETGREYTDSELKEIIARIPAQQQTMLKSKPVSEISKMLNTNGFNISDTSIKRAMELMA